MLSYKNFDIAIYFTTRCIASIKSMEEFREDFRFFEKHLKCSKIYLETHRDDMDVSAEKLKQLKAFFEEKGVCVSGAITTTLMRTIKNKTMIDETGVFGCGGTILEKSGIIEKPAKEGTKRMWNTLCYTDEASRHRLIEIVEFSASIFDEIILDDFYFTNCTCPSCIEAKGEQTWEEFRLSLMTEVSQNLVIKPAKAVNPKVNMIIKYPNWYEAYQQSGYNPETQPNIFDMVYTGTETRDTNHSSQHLPRYASYSLPRWLENLTPGRNGGGWIDQLGSIQNINYYLEQAYLTFFAKEKELTLFCYSWLVDTVYIPPLGHELEHLDKIIGVMGTPYGIPVYEPFHAEGEEHLYDYLGMVGIAYEPMPFFPKTDGLIFLTANSTRDKDILNKVKAHLLEGGDVCITSGFIQEMQGKGIEEITLVRYSDRKVYTKEYRIEGSSRISLGQFHGRKEVVLPCMKYSTNTAVSLISARKEDNNFPILLRNEYGRGKVYTLTIPDDYAEIYQYPVEVLTAIRKYLMCHLGIYLSCGEKVSIFLYDNNTFVLESFNDHPSKVTVHIAGGDKQLVEVRYGKEIPAINRKQNESVFEIDIQPLFYRVFRIE